MKRQQKLETSHPSVREFHLPAKKKRHAAFSHQLDDDMVTTIA